MIAAGSLKEWVIREAEDTYRHARRLDQTASARGALELIAKLHGYIVERKDLHVIRRIEDLTDDELQALVQAAEREQGGTRH